MNFDRLSRSGRSPNAPAQWGGRRPATALIMIFAILLAACGGEAQQPTATVAATAAIEATATEPPASAEPTPTSPPMATAAPPEEEPTAPFTATPPSAATAEPTAPPATQLSSLTLAPIIQGFDNPTYLTHAADERLFVTEQEGRVQVIVDGRVAAAPFLDITDRVGSRANEQGLLGLAFHPNYAENGVFFVDYTDANGDTVISRFQVTDDPNVADPASEQLVLAVPQPFPNHNGGQILFGADGYLYVGLGDGGSGGDPQNNGQNPNTLLGSILRLDVDSAGESTAYAIPPDNPLANGGGAAEVWAYGLRNPWRFSFDPLNNMLFVADVGQNQFEEINAVAAGQAAGANYGWNIMEGLHCFNSQECDPTGLRLPVVEYSHEQGGCSVTGGYMYRGEQYPTLAGNYFFGDYCSGFIWALRQDEQGQWTTGAGALITVDGQITSFGQDVNGEIYVVTRGGVIYQVQP